MELNSEKFTYSLKIGNAPLQMDGDDPKQKSS